MNAKVALITGGFTEEAQVSLKSAAFVEEQLLRCGRFNVYKIIVTRESWYYETGGVRRVIDRNDFSLHLDDGIVRFDVAFIMIHGSPGEDGKLQGYFDIIGMPYTSCDTLTAALTMNKAYTKMLLQDIDDLYVAKSILLFEGDRSDAVRRINDTLPFPVFVKPNCGGSSIGMSKVKQHEQLEEAIDKAFHTENTGRQVIVEQFVAGREFSVGVYRRGGELVVLPATEVVTTREFFDFEAKYVPGLTQEITPADLSGAQRSRIEQLVKAIYSRLNCKGMVRVDFFLENSTGYFYFIEINTIPGQTAQSFIPQQVRAAGISEADFYAGLIEETLGAK